MKRNVLSENMRRFGTKNLNEQVYNLMNDVASGLQNGSIKIPGFKWSGFLLPTADNPAEYGFKLESLPTQRGIKMELQFKRSQGGQQAWITKMQNKSISELSGTWEYDANSKTIKLLDQTGKDVTNSFKNVLGDPI